MQEEEEDALEIRLHTFQTLYNVDKATIPRKYRKQVNETIQEIKRAIVYRRYVANTSARTIRYDEDRIKAHLLINLKKCHAHRRYQGKNVQTLEGLVRIVESWY